MKSMKTCSAGLARMRLADGEGPGWRRMAFRHHLHRADFDGGEQARMAVHRPSGQDFHLAPPPHDVLSL
jgi:hypothetical protein